MNMKTLMASTALLAVFGTVAYADLPGNTMDCSADGSNCSQNNANIDLSDQTDNANATITNDLSKAYNNNSFDMSGSSQNNKNTAVGQGGTGGNATSTGNVSNNDNKSSAQIGANLQTNGNISNDVRGGTLQQGQAGSFDQTGGDFSQGAQTGGDFSQGNMQGGGFEQTQTGGSLTQGEIKGGSNNQNIRGGSNFQDIAGGSNNQGDITGGNASGGRNTTTVNGGQADTTSGPAMTVSGPANTTGGSANTQGGNANTNSGDIRTGDSSVTGSGNSSARGGNQQQKASANNSGGNSRNQNTQGNQQRTNIDASTRNTYKEAANTVIAPQLGGYGHGNCFGDTNPSGSFTAGMGTIGWQATAARMKASNACAIIMAEERAMAGRPALAAYLASQDPNAHRALTQAGVVQKPSQVRREERQKRNSVAYTTCEVRNGAPYVVAKRGRSDEALQQCLNVIGNQPTQPVTRVQQQTVTCPQGSHWDGKGCWMPRK